MTALLFVDAIDTARPPAAPASWGRHPHRTPEGTTPITEDERDDLIDLLPKGMIVWNDDEELPHFGHATARYWLDSLGHPRSGPTHGCCKSCGCGGSCILGAFHDAMISSVVRELDRLGALKKPEVRS